MRGARLERRKNMVAYEIGEDKQSWRRKNGSGQALYKYPQKPWGRTTRIKGWAAPIFEEKKSRLIGEKKILCFGERKKIIAAKPLQISLKYLKLLCPGAY